MRALRNALFSNLGLRKFSTFWKFQNSFLHLIFRYLNSARDIHPIDINFNVKIKCYDLSYYYRSMSVCFLLILVLMSKGRLVLIHIFKYHMAWLIAIAVAFTYFKKKIIVNSWTLTKDSSLCLHLISGYQFLAVHLIQE